VNAPDAPLLVDHAGFYLRPEGRHWLTGAVPQADGPCDPEDFEPDLGLFEEVIWPRLYARAPGFAAVKVLRAWAGHYDFNRFDRNAVVGLWPGRANLYVLTGFSGHGLQQAPAMGRGLAELVTAGRYETLDLSVLGPDRMAEGAPLLEKAVV
jgi:glycine/D-amino acid oxidase-like deaminating enzyme